MESLLSIKHLEKDLEDFQLKDINLELPAGKIMGLIGVNGTGKTTLIQTILNLYRKDRGEVKVNGYSMESQEREAKDRIGFVLDKNMFEEHLSVLKNGLFFGRMYSRFNEQIFKELCRRFQVPLKRKLGNLSTGYKVRFQLAFALSHEAELFILDEPVSGLDPLFRKELMGYLKEIVEDGSRSVLLSTHITEDLDRIGDIIVLMKNGKIVQNLGIKELKERYLMICGPQDEMEKFTQEKLIYKEMSGDKSYALIRRPKNLIKGNYLMRNPSLEELLYCLEKGGYEYV